MLSSAKLGGSPAMNTAFLSRCPSPLASSCLLCFLTKRLRRSPGASPHRTHSSSNDVMLKRHIISPRDVPHILTSGIMHEAIGSSHDSREKRERSKLLTVCPFILGTCLHYIGPRLTRCCRERTLRTFGILWARDESRQLLQGSGRSE